MAQHTCKMLYADNAHNEGGFDKDSHNLYSLAMHVELVTSVAHFNESTQEMGKLKRT